MAAHLGIGLYRSAVKWGWPEGGDATVSRKWLKRAGLVITLVFLSLGLLSLAAYMKTGYEHRERAGERYRPTTMQLAPDASEGCVS